VWGTSVRDRIIAGLTQPLDACQLRRVRIELKCERCSVWRFCFSGGGSVQVGRWEQHEHYFKCEACHTYLKRVWLYLELNDIKNADRVGEGMKLAKAHPSVPLMLRH
jgi:hypothetical protein